MSVYVSIVRPSEGAGAALPAHDELAAMTVKELNELCGELGIAMGAIGSDVAISSASIALMTNDLRRIATLMQLSRKSQLVINQNLVFGMLFVFGGMILSIVGVMTPVWAAVLHAGSTLVIIFNSARLVRTGEELTFDGGSGGTGDN